jgi:hypothetical protein
MSKILFCGDPPMMDFSLIKLNGGENLLDMHSGAIYSLGSGELTKIITDAGMAMNNTLEATLRSMNPSQSIRVQIMIHGHTGFAFQAPMAIHQPGAGTKIKFMAGARQGHMGNNIIHAQPDGPGPGEHGYSNEEVSNIIVVGANLDPSSDGFCYVETDPGNIKHATKRDNEDTHREKPGNVVIAD